MKNFALLFFCLFITSQAWSFVPVHDDEKNEPSTTLKERLVEKVKSSDLYQQAELLFNPDRREQSEKNTLNLLAGIFGISSILLGAFLPGLGLALGLAGLVLGILGLSRKQGLEGLGITGIVIGALWILITTLAIILIIALF